MSKIQASVISSTELIVLLGLMTSLGALTIDLQLPAMPEIAAAFGLAPGNEQQWMITSYMFGFAAAQLFYGPVSDSIGRKPVLLFGLAVYIVGSIACLWVESFSLFLAARALQGVGAAAARIMVNAITRDHFAGNEMAKVTSLVMMIFIMVPVFAPTLGALILKFGPWQSIIYAYLCFGILLTIWVVLRLPESLSETKQRSFNLTQIWLSFKAVLNEPVSMVFAIISGLVFSGFMAYLNASEQIFSQMYDAKDKFPQIFGGIALFFGLAAFLNAKIVMRVGVYLVTFWAMFLLLLVNSIGFALTSIYGGLPPFWLLVFYLGFINICIGLIYGNLIAIAMLPLGNHAGMGASVIGVVSALIAASLGAFISQQISDNVTAVVMGFFGSSVLAFLLLFIFRKRVIEVTS